jgi:succinoglycan biosynthesis protein ExoA
MSIPITIIVPTLNEQSHIKECLESLRQQDYQNIVEILVIDGGSTDGTQEAVLAEGRNVRLLDNPRVTAASAMNIGINAATTDVFIRIDAHTLYAKDYVSRSVASFSEFNAQVVGGLMRPIGTSPFGKAVCAVTTSPFGVGPGKFHFSEKLEEVETVYLGIFDRSFVLQVGGYDEVNLQWAAEDQELNFRIRQAGGKVLLDPRIHSTYFPRDTPRALARQYHNYGMCKASTLAKHKTLPYWRPLAPAIMVFLSILWAFGMLLLSEPVGALLPFILYITAAFGVGMWLGRDQKGSRFRISVALSICHWTYGFGFLRGILRIVTFRKFDSRPKNGRR